VGEYPGGRRNGEMEWEDNDRKEYDERKYMVKKKKEIHRN